MTNAPPLQRLLIDAAREFNVGRYFEAHEVLEDGLDAIPDHLWELFVGLIQIAVGYHKTTLQLWSGAQSMLERGLDKVEPYPPEAGGINLEALRQQVRADIERLRAGRFTDARSAREQPRLQPLTH